MIRRIISALAAALLMGGSAVGTVGAEGDDGRFVITSFDAKAGEDFTLDISIEDSTRLAAFQLTLDYDETVFTLSNVESVDYSNAILGPAESVPFTMLWIDATGSHANQNGVYARLTFTTDKSAPSGEYDFTLSYSDGDCIDVYANSLDFDIVNGKVNLEGVENAQTKATKETTGRDKTTTSASDKKQTKTTKETKKTESRAAESKTSSVTETSTGGTETQASGSESKVSQKDESSEQGSESVTTTSAPENEPVVTEESQETDESSKADKAAATSGDSSSAEEDEGGSNVVIAVIAFAALCAVIAAVFVIVKKKGK